MIHFEDSIQIAYAKIDNYTPLDWTMYNERKDSGYTAGYNQGLLAGHDNGSDEAKEYDQRIFEIELREAKQQWNEGDGNDKHFEEITEEYEEPEVNDEWSFYAQT